MKPRCPPALYVWMANGDLSRLAGNAAKDQLPLQAIDRSDLTPELPKTRTFNGLPAWTNPVTGSHSYYRKSYGDRLVKIIPKSKLRVVRIYIPTYVGHGIPIKDVKWDSIDAVHYIRTSWPEGLVVSEEFVILRPQAVKEFTADPSILKPELEAELKKLQDPQFKYRREIEQEMIIRENRYAVSVFIFPLRVLRTVSGSML